MFPTILLVFCATFLAADTDQVATNEDGADVTIIQIPAASQEDAASSSPVLNNDSLSDPKEGSLTNADAKAAGERQVEEEAGQSQVIRFLSRSKSDSDKEEIKSD